MEYNDSQSREPIYNLYNQKIKKNFYYNKINNRDNNSIIKQKKIGSLKREILSNEKNNQKKIKTAKNSPEKSTEFYRNYSKENQYIKRNINNQLIKNNNKVNNEVFNDGFINNMKRIYSKKYSQNNIRRPVSNSLLMNQNNINGYLSGKIDFNSDDKRYELSNSGIIEKNKKNCDNNSNFYYNHNLLNYYYNNIVEEHKFKNIQNNPYKNFNINKNEFNNRLENSNSKRMVFSKKKNNYLLNNHNNMNFNLDKRNELDMENDFSNNANSNNRNEYHNNNNLIKNVENKLIKNFIKNNNFKSNHNNNSTNKIVLSKDKNRIYPNYKIKNSEGPNNRFIKKPDFNYLNKIKWKKDDQKYIINNIHNNHSGINIINNNLNSGDIIELSSLLSEINKTSRQNSNENKLEEDYYHCLNNEYNNIDDNIYSNPNKQLNNLIKSIEGYINKKPNNNIISKGKELHNNMSNKSINNNAHSSLNIISKEYLNNNNHFNNNTERKIKLKKDLINSCLYRDSDRQIKGYFDKGSNFIKSSSNNIQKATQISSTSNLNNKERKNDERIKSNKIFNSNDNINNNINNNISDNNANLNEFSLSKSNAFHTINDKKNSNTNIFKEKDHKSEGKYKLNKLSINNNISAINNSAKDLNLGKVKILHKKLSAKDLISFSTIQNNKKPVSKLYNNNSSIKLENIKTNLIKCNIPLTNSQSPTDKKEGKYFTNFNNQNKIELFDSKIENDKNIDTKNYDQNNVNKNIRDENVEIDNNEKKLNMNHINTKIIENKNDNNSEVNSSIKTNEFENRNISEFPINDNIIKSKIEKHNNIYMNKNNIMALNEKNKEIELKKDDIIILDEIEHKPIKEEREEDKKTENNESKSLINTKETKELFKSIHDSDTLIDKENHLPQLNVRNIPNVIDKNKFHDMNNDLDFIKEIKIKDINIKNNSNNQKIELEQEKESMKGDMKMKDDKDKKLEHNNERENIVLDDDKKDVDKIDLNEKKMEKENDKEYGDKKDNIDINFIQNEIILDEKDVEFINNELENQKKEKEKENVNDSLGNKNQRSIYKITQKINVKEKKYDLIKNMYKQDMLCEPINAKNPKKGNSTNSNSKNNIFISTITKDCEFYQNEQEKLSKYIKNYYQINKKYPKSGINFYLYGRQIGHGAFGQVNIALHIASGRLVAVKIFAKKNLKNSRAKQKIKTEIEMLSHFHHPFINQILDNFETDTHIFIVMEYVCGDLLGFIRKRGKLSESVSKLIFKQMIEGLKYIHKKKVVHRDIKLDNILIDLTNTIKICDFGVSRYYSKDELMFEHCGTPAYISPEIFENNGYQGTGCDIWSAGVTLYYMLGGVQPFKANSIKDLEKNIKKGDFKPLEEVSSEANNLIKGMLQVNPKKRLTVDEILNHPWLSKVDLNQRQKLNLFTEAEKILMSKFDVNYLNSDKSELIENFTLKNIENDDNKNSSKNGYTKSLIFAPYNSYIESNPNTNEDGEQQNVDLHFEEEEIYKEIKVMNDICKYGWRAQQANIQYELSNNGDFDNGLIKTQKEEDFKKENEKIEKLFKNKIKNQKKELLNNSGSNSSEEDFDNIKINEDILDKIEKEIGYDRKYIKDCIKKNKINYATGTYYLLAKENDYYYDFY